MNRSWVLTAVLLLSLPAGLTGQSPATWHDPSPHTVHFVTVDKGVKLEVLDWGGTGRSLVLLAGLGNTAHVFDDFAPKLTSEYHVYGITRRGYGASSAAESGYSADRLGDDVLAVLDALKINRPILVGHSIAGEELSSIGSRHPERVAGLVYLDAGFPYAYYSASQGDIFDFVVDWNESKKRGDEVTFNGPDQDRVQALLRTTLPTLEKDLQQIEETLEVLPLRPMAPPPPIAEDLESFASFSAYQKRVFGIEVPEAELRQMRDATPDGRVGPPRDPSQMWRAFTGGMEKYTEIPVPILAIFASPHDQGPYAKSKPEELAAFDAADTARMEGMAKSFESGLRSARVVRLSHANHYVFLSNEADVLREMRSFLETLH